MAKQKATWIERHRIGDNKEVTISAINDVIRKEAQDIGNSMHMDTKLKLIGLTRGTARKLFFQDESNLKTGDQIRQKRLLNYIHSLAKKKEKAYEKDVAKLKEDNNAMAIRNIAICEHLRWNASHEINGYVYGSETDIINKTHSCLKSWHDLPSNYQDYDFNVMEKTIELIINKADTNEDKQ